jgi:serine/threonine protein kinase
MSQGGDISSSETGATGKKQGLFAGRYRKVKLLGKGGMGEVFLVEDQSLPGSHIALKVIRSASSGSETHRQRFLREILVTRKVTHQNIVRTYDAGVTNNGILYLTMEYVEGHSLRELSDKGPMHYQQAVPILVQICQGLAAIHKSGIIHRDLKTGNVLVGTDGSAKIADFGIARIEDSDITGCDEIVGSSPYIAPEVWTGSDLANTSDIYSLGVLAYELLTSKLPFEGKTPAETMWKHLNDIPPSPSSVVRDIPYWLERVILSMLFKDHLNRPCDAEEIALHLQTGLAGSNAAAQDLKTEAHACHRTAMFTAHLPDLGPQFSQILGGGYVSENIESDEVRLGLSADLPQSALIVTTIPTKDSQTLTTDETPPEVPAISISFVGAVIFQTLRCFVWAVCLAGVGYVVTSEIVVKVLASAWLTQREQLDVASWTMIAIAVASCSALAFWPITLLRNKIYGRTYFLLGHIVILLTVFLATTSYTVSHLRRGAEDMRAMSSKIEVETNSAWEAGVTSFAQAALLIPQIPPMTLTLHKHSYRFETSPSLSWLSVRFAGIALIGVLVGIILVGSRSFRHSWGSHYWLRTLTFGCMLFAILAAEHVLIATFESMGIIARTRSFLIFSPFQLVVSPLSVICALGNWLLLYFVMSYENVFSDSVDEIRRTNTAASRRLLQGDRMTVNAQPRA